MPPAAIYGFHVLFFAMFLVRILGGRGTPSASAAQAPAPTQARFPRLVVHLHGLAFGVMYFGIGNAVFGRGWVAPGAEHPVVGAAILVAATGLVLWALLWFRSWKLAAAVDAGHELATGGPFARIRHPLYTGFDLLAIGSCVWLPSWITLAGAAAMIAASDVRARVEERLLVAAFGDRYRDYMTRTRRFVPFVY